MFLPCTCPRSSTLDRHMDRVSLPEDTISALRGRESIAKTCCLMPLRVWCCGWKQTRRIQDAKNWNWYRLWYSVGRWSRIVTLIWSCQQQQQTLWMMEQWNICIRWLVNQCMPSKSALEKKSTMGTLIPESIRGNQRVANYERNRSSVTIQGTTLLLNGTKLYLRRLTHTSVLETIFREGCLLWEAYSEKDACFGKRHEPHENHSLSSMLKFIQEVLGSSFGNASITMECRRSIGFLIIARLLLMWTLNRSYYLEWSVLPTHNVVRRLLWRPNSRDEGKGYNHTF